MSYLVNHWNEQHWEVTLVTLNGSVPDYFEVAENIQRIRVRHRENNGIWSKLFNNIHRIRSLRRAITSGSPDVIMSFGDKTNVSVILATLFMKIPIVVSERTDPRQHDIGSIWSSLRKLCYRRASALIVQTRGLQGWASQFGKKVRVFVIPNPVFPLTKGLDLDLTILPNSEKPKILAIGRLSQEKGFDVLIRAVGRIIANGHEVHLTIIGEGVERGNLEALVEHLGISANVCLPGRVQVTETLLRRFKVFVLASRYEGFPNVLLEAMAAGMPVIATRCPSGPEEIIRDRVDGILITTDNVEALGNALFKLINDDVACSRLGKNATRVLDRFSHNRIFATWDQMLQTIVGEN